MGKRTKKCSNLFFRTLYYLSALSQALLRLRAFHARILLEFRCVVVCFAKLVLRNVNFNFNFKPSSTPCQSARRRSATLVTTPSVPFKGKTRSTGRESSMLRPDEGRERATSIKSLLLSHWGNAGERAARGACSIRSHSLVPGMSASSFVQVMMSM